MSKWISIKEAARKYNLEKEHIQLWVDMKAVVGYFKDCTIVVDDQSLRAFLKLKEQGISRAYVDILEHFCITQSGNCMTYAINLGARDKEIEMYREAKKQRDTFRGMYLEQIDRISDLEFELDLERNSCCKCWLKKLCMRIRKIKTHRLVGMRLTARWKRS